MASAGSVPSAAVRPHPRPWRRAVRDGLGVAGLLFAGYLFVVIAPASGTFGFDAFAYWSLDLGHPYARTAGALGAFTYSPVIARLFAPFSILPWPAFAWLWSAVLLATVAWLGWRHALLVLAFPPVALELYHGNVHLLMAAAIALGFRYPATWAFVLLTKVTPGVGLVWFLVRREWRRLAIALGVTAALVVASVAVDARLWQEWIGDSLFATASGAPLNQASLPVPLWLRVPVAALVVGWGARTERAWTVPLGATLALPILWPTGLAVLAACWPIAQRRPGLTDERTIGGGPTPATGSAVPATTIGGPATTIGAPTAGSAGPAPATGSAESPGRSRGSAPGSAPGS